ncbi:6-phosphogluconolactonase [Heliorestis acidaminivorans]|uniref:6-phosphogluconolactonase n=1 Tax=Heliorestis acidaminivorans TaxID=553427 RepID=A0A6I0ET02_9FIRM|nr:6-phosphogluconolactonase [Heliorestis acidaminivorans]KAB2953745.1 6-phosphogluconolactonase [Heliorestis acidaminivorans]
MKKEYFLSDAKFIYSKDELGYQEVLDDFKNAEEIIIVTYNISEKQLLLIQKLSEASSDAEISIFTNIPSRWDTYYGDAYKNTARKKINVYLTKLKPDSIGEKVSVFFNFDNHGKIIMTNNLAYVGSANYSEESVYNIEFGIISRDIDFITFLKEEITKELEKSSTPYFEYDYLPLLLEIKMHLSNLFALRGELFDQIYSYYDDLDGKGYFYNDTEERLNQKTIDNIIVELDKCSELMGTICDASDHLTEEEYILDDLNDYYEALRTLENQFEDVSSNEEVYELACFDSSERAIQIIQDEYSAEAYDEYLEGYVQKAMDSVHEEFQDICQESKESLDDMLEILDKYLDSSRKALEEFEELEFRKINGNIDNT